MSKWWLIWPPVCNILPQDDTLKAFRHLPVLQKYAQQQWSFQQFIIVTQSQTPKYVWSMIIVKRLHAKTDDNIFKW